MVSFTCISQSVLFASVIIFGLADAAPHAAGSKKAATLIVPHKNITTNATPAKLPSIISSRTSPVTNPPDIGVLNAEEVSAEKNKEWFVAHGGNITSIEKRESNTVAGFTLKVPANAPPMSKIVTTATSAQVTDYKFHATIASTAYCDTVVPKGAWSCTNCKAIPDGKLIVTFSTSSNDIGGFILKSDAKKTIYLVFRGTNSYTNWIVVSNGFECE